MRGSTEFFDELADQIAQRVIAHIDQRAPQPQPAAQPQATQYLTTKAAATLLGLGASTLELWRAKGKGPSFVKLPGAGGAVRYAKADLDSWIAAHAKRRK